MGPVEFEFWEDKDGRCYVQELLDDLFDDVEAEQIAQVLGEDYSTIEWENLVQDEKVREEEDGLYYVRLDYKGRQVRFFGCLRGRKLLLVHVATKLPNRTLALGHYETAKERIKEIQ